MLTKQCLLGDFVTEFLDCPSLGYSFFSSLQALFVPCSDLGWWWASVRKGHGMCVFSLSTLLCNCFVLWFFLFSFVANFWLLISCMKSQCPFPYMPCSGRLACSLVQFVKFSVVLIKTVALPLLQLRTWNTPCSLSLTLGIGFEAWLLQIFVHIRGKTFSEVPVAYVTATKFWGQQILAGGY